MRSDRLYPGLLAATGAALGLCFALASCGSSQQSGGGSGGQAEQTFENQVYPALQPTCTPCHQTGARGAPVFLASNATGSYTAIQGVPGLVAAPNASPLIQHGVHSGPALTPDQVTVVSNWLTQEASTRNLVNPGQPANLRSAFLAFGACMDYGQWVKLGLDQIAQTQTTDSGKCLSCHGAGQGANWLSDDPGDTFVHLTKFPYVQRLVTGTVTASGAFDSIVDARRLIDKGTEAQQPQANSHPQYSLDSTTAANLTQFVNDTISNMAANRCQSVERPEAGADGAF